MNIFTRHPEPTCEEQLEELRRRIRELEFLQSKNPARLDVDNNALVINGMSYSLALFENLGGVGDSFLPIGACFELIGRAGGSIQIREIRTELDARRMLKTVVDREAKRAGDFKRLEHGDLHE